MRVSIEWIKDFVNLPNDLTAQELSNRFTLGSCEVEKIDEGNPLWEKVKVVKILDISKHPNADQLNIVKIDATEDIIVCGANNLYKGMITVWAPIGTAFDEDFVLTSKEIRGVVSHGMLCSEKELGISNNHDGIIDLNKKIPLGSFLAENFSSPEPILEIDNKSITHRPDMWGHYGMAREFAVLFESSWKKRFDNEWIKEIQKRFTSEKSPIKPIVKDKENCLGYLGISLDNIKVEESPLWLSRRLRDCGIRSINNIVDISNYVMLEMGIPVHIFDRKKLAKSSIEINSLDRDMDFTTLDGVTRSLKSGDTVVADGEKPQVIAGIMGGLDSSVTEETSQIFIESAIWRAAGVRETSLRLGLRTDSSLRYEKSLDPSSLEVNILRVVDLILQICPEAKVVGSLESGGVELHRESLKVSLSLEKVTKTLGKDIPEERILSILNGLELKSDLDDKGNLIVTIPSFRATKDISLPEDIIEEVGRVIGYDNITPESPKVSISPVRLPEGLKQSRELRKFLAMNAKAQEIYTYPLIGNDFLDLFEWNHRNEELKLANPLTHDADRMRSTLIPGGINAFLTSQAQYPFENYRLFELGRSYFYDKNNFSQDRYQVFLGFFNKFSTPFIELRTQLEQLIKTFKYPLSLVEKNEDSLVIDENWTGLHPFEKLDIIREDNGQRIGTITSLHPNLLKKIKLKGYLSFFALDYTELMDKNWQKVIKALSPNRYPVSFFDCTVNVNKECEVRELINAIETSSIPYVTKVEILNIYFDNEKEKSITIRSVLHNPKETLKSEELSQCEKNIILSLEKKGFLLKKS